MTRSDWYWFCVACSWFPGLGILLWHLDPFGVRNQPPTNP